MASSEAPHYLHPDFDPWKLKMDQIRDILIQHHVKTPTGIVRKQQLVDLFNKYIRPQVPELSQEEKYAEASDRDELSSSSKTRPPPAKHLKQLNEEDAADITVTGPTRVRRMASKQRLESEESAEVLPTSLYILS